MEKPSEAKLVSDQVQRIVLVCLVAVVIAVGAKGVGLGLGHDLDGRSILEKSVPAILQGGYAPGRSYGNPLYEFIAAWLYAAGGIVLANSYSVVLALGSIAVFYRLLDQADGDRRTLALIGFCFGPVFLTNAYAFGEWMQTFFLILCLLWAAFRWLHDQRYWRLAVFAVLNALLVLTRPDAAFICVSICLALLWELRLQIIPSVQLIVASILAAAATAITIIAINRGFGFLGGLAFDENNTWSRSFLIAALGVLTVFGLLGALVLLGCAAQLVARLGGKNGEGITFWGKLFLVGAVIGLLRYILFPQKLEYIFPLLIFALLMMTYERVGRVWLGLVCLSIILPTFFTISIFERSGSDDHLNIGPHIDQSAILQDWVTSRADWEVMDPGFLKKMSERIYGGEGESSPRLSTTTWGPGLLSDKGDLIIGSTEAYRLDNPRLGGLYKRAQYHRIYICDKSVFHGSPGWRFLERPVARLSIDPKTGAVDVDCHLEDKS
jgi:hypothetical protein